MKVIKKNEKANTEDTLGKKERKKAKNPKGVAVMTQTPKKAKGIAKVMEVPSKEKTLRESTMLREENLQQYAKKIADQHNLILIPQPLDKPQLYQMWKKEKGSFGTKAGVMTFVPNTKTVNVLSSDEKVPEAVFVQFKADKGGNDQGFETKTFAEDGAKGYFKNFSIADVNEAKVKALKENIIQELTMQNPTYEHFQVGARVKKKDNSLVGEITEWDGDTATIKTDEGEVHHIQGNILTKKDVPNPKEEAAKTGTSDEWAKPKAHIPEDQHKSEEKSKEEKIKNLKEKLMKTVRETKALIVPKAATGTQVDQIVQQKMPAAKAGDTVDIIRK
jgi:alpha-acetolactate decarboxylase